MESIHQYCFPVYIFFWRRKIRYFSHLSQKIIVPWLLSNLRILALTSILSVTIFYCLAISWLNILNSSICLDYDVKKFHQNYTIFFLWIVNGFLSILFYFDIKTSILQYFTGKSFIFYQSLTWYNSFFQLFVFYSLHLSPKEFIFCFTASSGKAKGL